MSIGTIALSLLCIILLGSIGLYFAARDCFVRIVFEMPLGEWTAFEEVARIGGSRLLTRYNLVGLTRMGKVDVRLKKAYIRSILSRLVQETPKGETGEMVVYFSFFSAHHCEYFLKERPPPVEDEASQEEPDLGGLVSA